MVVVVDTVVVVVVVLVTLRGEGELDMADVLWVICGGVVSVVVDAQQTFIVTFMFRRKQAPWFGFARPSNVPVDVVIK